MKLIGHVSTAIIAAAPAIYFRDKAPGLDIPELSNFELLWWVGIFATVPDLDILLCRFTPIKHRGYASHSLLTALFCGGIVLGLWAFFKYPPAFSVDFPKIMKALLPAARFCGPGTALLAFLAVTIHLLGDSLTKTGVPILLPNQHWHFPVIGGRAAFDNYFLNAIPMVAAIYILISVFHFNPGVLHRFGKWRDILPRL